MASQVADPVCSGACKCSNPQDFKSSGKGAAVKGQAKTNSGRLYTAFPIECCTISLILICVFCCLRSMVQQAEALMFEFIKWSHGKKKRTSGCGNTEMKLAVGFVGCRIQYQ